MSEKAKLTSIDLDNLQAESFYASRGNVVEIRKNDLQALIDDCRFYLKAGASETSGAVTEREFQAMRWLALKLFRDVTPTGITDFQELLKMAALQLSDEQWKELQRWLDSHWYSKGD